MKTVYQTDGAGWYVGPTVAHESPLEPGVHLMPAGCTDDPPPEPEAAGTWPRHIAGAWVMQYRQPPEAEQTPAQKLAAFLAAHPDVAAMVSSQSTGV